MNDIDVLRNALHSGIIDLSTIQNELRELERLKTLKEHSHKIWQGNNGYWYTYVIVGNERRLIKKRDKSALDSEIIKTYEGAHITVEHEFKKWIEQKGEYHDIQKQTIDRYKTDFTRYFGKIKNKPIKYITEDDLERFIKTTIVEKEMTHKRWSNMRTLIYGIWKYAKRNKHTDLSITSFMGDLELSRKIFKKRIVDDEEQVLSNDEYDKIIEWTYNEVTHLTIGVRIALLTGLRAGEIVTLKISDLKDNVLTVQRTEVRYKDKDGKTVYDVREETKGAVGYRKIILTDEARDTLLQAYELFGGEYLIEHDGKRVKGQGLSLKLYRICGRLKIPNRSLHKCRKTYATRLIDAGVPEKLIINQLGHTSIETTRSYYWFRNSTVEEDKQLLERAFCN